MEGLRTMIEIWGTFLFSWPLMFLALLINALGVFQKKPVAALLGAVFALPFTITMLAIEFVGLFAIIIPICMFAAFLTVAMEISKWAWILLIPVLGLLLWIGVNIYSII